LAEAPWGSRLAAWHDSRASWRRKCGVRVWARLMPNHVHPIAVPESAEGLRRAIGQAHRRYTRAINFREGWRGRLCNGLADPDLHLLSRHERTGRPLRRQRPGPKAGRVS
jgi:REP element-mobilizing transposase RayT